MPCKTSRLVKDIFDFRVCFLFHRVFGLPKDFKEGIVFSTYATLVSSVQKGTTILSILPIIIIANKDLRTPTCLYICICIQGSHCVENMSNP